MVLCNYVGNMILCSYVGNLVLCSYVGNMRLCSFAGNMILCSYVGNKLLCSYIGMWEHSMANDAGRYSMDSGWVESCLDDTAKPWSVRFPRS